MDAATANMAPPQPIEALPSLVRGGSVKRRKLGRTVEQFDEVLNAFGMRGRRVTPQELEWLLYRSVALCMSPPGPLSPVTSGQWDSGDLLALTERGREYVRLADQIWTEVEEYWAALVGQDRIEAIRQDLTAYLDSRYGDARIKMRPVW